MGSPITFSGFNQIDFNLILNAVMQQERRPLQVLEQRKQTLQGAEEAYASLATKLGALQSAARELADPSTVAENTVTSSAEQSVAVSATSAAVPGRYEVIVSELARAQVTAAASTAPDTNTTTVASGGTLTIGGVAVALAVPVTLSGLADAINGTSGIPVTATVVESSPGAFRLVLTGNQTGASNAFTVTNSLAGSTVAFTDTDADGVSGDSAADNAMQAANAAVLINNVAIASATNVLESGIPGVTLTLLRQDPTTAVVVDVGRDDDRLADRVKTFIAAYNDLVKLAGEELATTGPLGRDAVVRGLRGELRAALTAAYGAAAFTRLAEAGIGFTRTGQLTLDETALTEALQSNRAAVTSLFSDADAGAFDVIHSLVREYTQADGFVPDARTRLSEEIARLATQIAHFEERLALRREALQREFMAADQAMSRLNAQTGAIASFGGRLSSTGL